MQNAKPGLLILARFIFFPTHKVPQKLYILDPALSTTGHKYDLLPSRGVKIKANLHRGKEQFYYTYGKKSSYSRLLR